MSGDFTWHDAALAKLRELWAQGMPTREIALCFGVTKNAVVGKAHRLNLASRPSPILRGVQPQVRRTRRVRGATLAPLPSTAPSPPLIAQAAVFTPAVEPQPVIAAPARTWRTKPCCWPIGEPGTKEFHFCPADAVGERVYCAEHAARAYVRVRDRRDTPIPGRVPVIAGRVTAFLDVSSQTSAGGSSPPAAFLDEIP